MSTSALDPMIHNPQRLRIVATLAALPDGELVQAAQDLPDLTVFSAQVSLCCGKRARSRRMRPRY